MSLLAYQHGDGEGVERVVDALYKMWLEGSETVDETHGLSN